jgi:hypothetical protein
MVRRPAHLVREEPIPPSTVKFLRQRVRHAQQTLSPILQQRPTLPAASATLASQGQMEGRALRVSRLFSRTRMVLHSAVPVRWAASKAPRTHPRVRAVNRDTIPWEDNLSARSALRTASPRQAATRRIARVMVSQLPCIPLNILTFLMSFLYT